MKKFIISLGLAALLGTPALAQSYNPEYGSGNTLVVPPSYAAQAYRGEDGTAYAYASRQNMHGLHGVRAQAPAASAEVYVLGHDAGTDPDPKIRVQLQRDWPGRD
jgi:hypothetical protein